MSEQLASGQRFRIANLPQPARSQWLLWQSLRRDILRHLHECDRQGVSLTVDKLATDLDEALGLVERRTLELQSLRLVCVHDDRRIELPGTPQRMCG